MVTEIPPGDRVLFVRYSALGDVIQASALARALKTKFPGVLLTWLVTSPLDDLVRGQPFVDDVLVWYRSRGERGFLELIREVRRRKFHRMVSAQSSDRTALLALFSGIPWRCGAHRWLSGVYGEGLDDLRRSLSVPPLRGILSVPEDGRIWAQRELSSLPPRRVGFAIGASKAVKRWPDERWGALARELVARGVGVLLLGDGEEERLRGEALARDLPFVENAVSSYSLRQTLAAVGALDALVGGDSGVLHMALALGVPTVGLFGPTLPAQVALGGVDRALLGDCPQRGCQRWECPTPCLGTIDASTVLGALEDLERPKIPSPGKCLARRNLFALFVIVFWRLLAFFDVLTRIVGKFCDGSPQNASCREIRCPLESPPGVALKEQFCGLLLFGIPKSCYDEIT